jgi:general secretion pathway protein K
MSERGSIAILALWGVALIAVLLGAMNFLTRSEIAIAGNVIAVARARHAAEAGTQLGLARLLRRKSEGADRLAGPLDTWQEGAARAEITVVDEAGKIDVNLAPLELLSGLFIAVGRPREEALLLACNILDHRGDSNSICPEPPDTAAGPGTRFAAPEELAQLPGFDEALYDAIADSITVATGATAIDPRVAPRPVLMAIPGATPELVDAFLASRSLWQDPGAASGAGGMAAAAPFVMASPQRDFTIVATATAGRARYRADLQVRLTSQPNQPYEVLAWRTPPADRGGPATTAPRRVP